MPSSAARIYSSALRKSKSSDMLLSVSGQSQEDLFPSVPTSQMYSVCLAAEKQAHLVGSLETNISQGRSGFHGNKKTPFSGTRSLCFAYVIGVKLTITPAVRKEFYSLIWAREAITS